MVMETQDSSVWGYGSSTTTEFGSGVGIGSGAGLYVEDAKEDDVDAETGTWIRDEPVDGSSTSVGLGGSVHLSETGLGIPASGLVGYSQPSGLEAEEILRDGELRDGDGKFREELSALMGRTPMLKSIKLSVPKARETIARLGGGQKGLQKFLHFIYLYLKRQATPALNSSTPPVISRSRSFRKQGSGLDCLGKEPKRPGWTHPGVDSLVGEGFNQEDMDNRSCHLNSGLESELDEVDFGHISAPSKGEESLLGSSIPLEELNGMLVGGVSTVKQELEEQGSSYPCMGERAQLGMWSNTAYPSELVGQGTRRFAGFDLDHGEYRRKYRTLRKHDRSSSGFGELALPPCLNSGSPPVEPLDCLNPLWGPLAGSGDFVSGPSFDFRSLEEQSFVNPVMTYLPPPVLDGAPVMNSAARTKEARKNAMKRSRRSASLSGRWNHPAPSPGAVGHIQQHPPTVRPTHSPSFPVEVQGSNAVQSDGVERDKNSLFYVLQKQLQTSDTSTLGRIVLPKKECDHNMPTLHHKDGIPFSCEDYETGEPWIFKYRWWPNNKSRMYVMENTGPYVKKNDLVKGDTVTLYKTDTNTFIIQGTKSRESKKQRCQELPLREEITSVPLGDEISPSGSPDLIQEMDDLEISGGGSISSESTNMCVNDVLSPHKVFLDDTLGKPEQFGSEISTDDGCYSNMFMPDDLIGNGNLGLVRFPSLKDSGDLLDTIPAMLGFKDGTK